MRDLDTIDSELRLLAAVRWSIREHGGEPSSHQVDELLDERNELTGSYRSATGHATAKGYKLAELRVCGSGGKAGIDRCRWLENPKVIAGNQPTTATIREGNEFGTRNRAGATVRCPGG